MIGLVVAGFFPSVLIYAFRHIWWEPHQRSVWPGMFWIGATFGILSTGFTGGMGGQGSALLFGKELRFGNQMAMGLPHFKRPATYSLETVVCHSGVKNPVITADGRLVATSINFVWRVNWERPTELRKFLAYYRDSAQETAREIACSTLEESGLVRRAQFALVGKLEQGCIHELGRKGPLKLEGDLDNLEAYTPDLSMKFMPEETEYGLWILPEPYLEEQGPELVLNLP